MSFRVVHTITSACDITLDKSQKDFIRIRITENVSDSCPSEAADFEIEGYIPALQDLIATLSAVMDHVNGMGTSEEEAN